MGFPIKLAERRPKAPEAALLGLLRGVPLLPGLEKSWPEVLDLAEGHGVAPLLHAVAPELPDEARHDLRRLRAAAQAERGWQQAALLRVGGALEGAGALVVHAAAYAEDLYTAPELRPVRALEMLIAPSPRSSDSRGAGTASRNVPKRGGSCCGCAIRESRGP